MNSFFRNQWKEPAPTAILKNLKEMGGWGLRKLLVWGILLTG